MSHGFVSGLEASQDWHQDDNERQSEEPHEAKQEDRKIVAQISTIAQFKNHEWKHEN